MNTYTTPNGTTVTAAGIDSPMSEIESQTMYDYVEKATNAVNEVLKGHGYVNASVEDDGAGAYITFQDGSGHNQDPIFYVCMPNDSIHTDFRWSTHDERLGGTNPDLEAFNVDSAPEEVAEEILNIICGAAYSPDL